MNDSNIDELLKHFHKDMAHSMENMDEDQWKEVLKVYKYSQEVEPTQEEMSVLLNLGNDMQIDAVNNAHGNLPLSLLASSLRVASMVHALRQIEDQELAAKVVGRSAGYFRAAFEDAKRAMKEGRVQRVEVPGEDDHGE